MNKPFGKVSRREFYIALFLRNDDVISNLKGVILAGVLMYASIRDIHTRVVPDWIWITVAGLGLIGIQLQDLPGMIFSAIAVLLILIPLTVLMKEWSLGGADIKVSAAGAFILGGLHGLYALILGITLAVITVPLIYMICHQQEKQSFALIPYLAAGIMIVYLFI